MVPTETLARGDVDGYGDALLSRIRRVPEHVRYFPLQNGEGTVVPFILPPAHDKLLGYDPIVDLWEDMHRTFDVHSMVTVIGYAMRRHDAHAYEALGRLLINYQRGGETNAFGQRRVPLQVVTKASAGQEGGEIPFLDAAKTRVWRSGFCLDALGWLDWAD